MVEWSYAWKNIVVERRGKGREWISMVGQGQWTPQAPETGTKVGAETKASRAWEGDEQGGKVTIRETVKDLVSCRLSRLVVSWKVGGETMRWPLL